MLNNNTYLKENELYKTQIETSEIYKKKIEEEIEKLKSELEKCNKNNYNNDNNDNNDNKEELDKQMKNIKYNIEILENKKINLEETIKNLENNIINKEKHLLNELNKNKTNSQKTYHEILNIFQENNIETDIELKLKEKNEQENILTYLIENINIDNIRLKTELDKLINTNEMNNKIIVNINNNIKKINKSTKLEEKEQIRLINNNLKKSLEDNKIVFNELKENIDIFLKKII